MLHVALRFAGRTPVGAFITDHDYRRILAMRAENFDGAVCALDSGATPFRVQVAELTSNPDVYGYGADPLE